MVGICNKTRRPPRGARNKRRTNPTTHAISLCAPFFPLLFSAIAHGPVRCYPYPRSPYPLGAQLKTKPHYGGSCKATLPPFFQAPHLAQRNLNPLLLSSTTIHYAKNKIKSQHLKEMLPFLSVSVSLLSLLSSSSSLTLTPSHSHTETRVSRAGLQLPDQIWLWLLPLLFGFPMVLVLLLFFSCCVCLCLFPKLHAHPCLGQGKLLGLGRLLLLGVLGGDLGVDVEHGLHVGGRAQDDGAAVVHAGGV